MFDALRADANFSNPDQYTIVDADGFVLGSGYLFLAREISYWPLSASRRKRFWLSVLLCLLEEVWRCVEDG